MPAAPTGLPTGPQVVEAPCDLAGQTAEGTVYLYAEAEAPAEDFAVYTCRHQDIPVLPALCEEVDTYTVEDGQVLVLCGRWGEQVGFVRIEKVPGGGD